MYQILPIYHLYVSVIWIWENLKKSRIWIVNFFIFGADPSPTPILDFNFLEHFLGQLPLDSCLKLSNKVVLYILSVEEW